MAFECYECGECCYHLGLVHAIRKSYGDQRFLICKETRVEVDNDKRELLMTNAFLQNFPWYARYSGSNGIANLRTARSI